MPEHVKWLNGGKMDGAKLSKGQNALRTFYSKLLKITTEHEAIRNGAFYDLLYLNEWERGFNNKVYPYLRYTDQERLLIIANFNRDEVKLQVKFTNDLLNQFNIATPGNYVFTDLISQNQVSATNLQEGLQVNIEGTCGVILSF